MSTSPNVTLADSVMVRLERISTDAAGQTRTKVRDALVREYAAAMIEQLADGGLRFPPVILFQDGDDYALADGFHRVLAAGRAGLTEIAAHVRPGSRRDAIFFGISANNEHGLPRTKADKRKMVQLLLADPEWSQWSDREIARRCQVAHTCVSHVRHGASGAKLQIARKVERGGAIYEMTVKPHDGVAADAPSAPAAAADALGIPLSEPMVKVFAVIDHFKKAEELVDQLAAVVDRIAQEPGGSVLLPELIRTAADGGRCFADPMVRALRNRLDAAKPYCSRCPHCHRVQPGRAFPNCKVCGGRGWTTRPAFERTGQHERQEILNLTRQSLKS